MEELLILVDRLDHKRGTAPKLKAHQLGLLHRAFSIFIFDGQGRVLLQQRALGKYHSPGLWSNTCCGHPRPGERTMAAARRRLQEEMGLACPLRKVTSLLYHEVVPGGLTEHEFDHIFVGISHDDPRANPDEAHDWQWLSLPHLLARINEAPQDFTVWLRRICETTSLKQWHDWTSVDSQPAITQDPYTVPPLYCPAVENIDEALGAEVNRRLMAWVEQVGIFPDKLEAVRASGFGRFAMLCHRDTDDPDRVLLAAQCMAALFAVDDYYCDDERTGSEPRLVGPRLSLALAAMEPAHLVPAYAAELKQALDRDPVLVGLRAYISRVEQLSSPAQLARVRHETIAMFVTMTAEAAWRLEGLNPAIWEYLAQRQINSFLPCLALIDVIGGYELPANLYSRPDVRQVITLAASATIIANDLYSARKESKAQIGDFNLPGLIVRERGCSLAEAMSLSAQIHDQVVRLYEQAEQSLPADGSPLLARYLKGVKTWLAGNLEWHKHSGRYHS